MVAITPQRPEHSRALVAQHALTFDLLWDSRNTVAGACRLTHRLPEELEGLYRAFKIDLSSYNGDESWTLPMPARYVIDAGGQIRAADVNADYTRRPEPDVTVEAVQAIVRTA